MIRSLYDEMQSKQSISKNLSVYASKNIAEFIAEAWSEFKNNAQPRDTAIIVGERINELNRKRNEKN